MSNIFNGKKGYIQNSTKSKGNFQVGFIDIITATVSSFLTNETTFSNYILIVDTYSKTPKMYGMDRIITK